MVITKSIKMELNDRHLVPSVDVMQYDANTRALEFRLFCNGEPWTIPDGLTAAVSYRKADGTVGLYDTLSDGSPAVTLAENMATAVLAEQALTAAGRADLSVLLLDGQGKRLATFSIILRVCPDPAAGMKESKNYINMCVYMPQPAAGAAVGQYLQVEEVNDAGQIIGLKAVDAPTGGGVTASEKTLILDLFRNAAYTADMSATFARLEALWSGSGDSGDGGDDNTGDSGEEETHTHSYTSSVTTAATCETAGVRTYTCSCGHSYTEAIPATGHNYVDGVCAVCGAADPDYEEPESTEPVYTLAEATTFAGDGSDVIDTELALLSERDSVWSISITTNVGAFSWARQHILEIADNNFSYAIAANGKYNVRIGLSGINENTIFPKDTADAKAVIARISGGVIRVYYAADGAVTSIDAAAPNNNTPQSTNTLKIGSSFNGTVNNMAVYMRELTEAEIKEYLGVSA